MTALLLFHFDIFFLHSLFSRLQHSTCSPFTLPGLICPSCCYAGRLAEKAIFTSTTLFSNLVKVPPPKMKRFEAGVVPTLYLLLHLISLGCTRAAVIDTKYTVNQRPRSLEHTERSALEARKLNERVGISPIHLWTQ